MHHNHTTILCLASYFKGGAFLEEAKRLGCQVILLTRQKLAHADWPTDSIDERFLMPDLQLGPNLIHAVSYLARDRQIDAIVPLDDFDVETAAHLREHLRLPGLGDSQVRFFRDKLAMRMQASAAGIPVPAFVHVLNHKRLAAFMAATPPPWVLKPRSSAGSIGLKKIQHSDELWPVLDQLGDQQSYYLLEHFLPGDVFHVDSIIWDGEVLYSVAHRYARPPMSVMHEGGVFITTTVPRQTELAQALTTINRQVIEAKGLQRGVTHAEFIRSAADGQLYFLEIAARVGGANIDRLVEAAAGFNLWREWARIETAAARGEVYTLPPIREAYAGLAICLARQQWPDTGAYQDPEIVWRLGKEQHAGLLVAAAEPERVEALMDAYSQRFAVDFLAVVPPPDKPID